MSSPASGESGHFFDDRWEQDRIRHFYFLDTPPYKKLTSLSKHVVLKGHRGTGKTTLLRALDWRERLTNEHLRSVLRDDPFSDRIVGCFLQIKFLPVNMIDIWLSESHAEIRHTIISTYLRASWLVEACEALTALNSQYRFASFREEIEALGSASKATWSWLPNRYLSLPTPANEDILTLESIKDIASNLMRVLRSAAAIESPAPEVLVARLDLTQFGALVNRIFVAMGTLVGRLDPSAPWSFRICMDEGEFLSPGWATSVRSLIRETDTPVYLAVSVLQSLGSQTMSSGAELSIDDRELIDLDDRPPEQMAHLLTGILHARMTLGGSPNSTFDLRSFLGNPDVTELFALAVRTSERSPLAATSRKNSKNSALTGIASSTDPIRRYLESTGAIVTSADLAGKESRRFESVGYRKKKTAGYLNLLGALGIAHPTYAGWRIAVAMADNSVRDFMRFLRYGMEIWANRPDDDSPSTDTARFFAQPRLSYSIQDGALNRLGQKKMESIPTNITDSAEADVLMRLFGEISHRVDYFSDAKISRPNATRLRVRPGELAVGQGGGSSGITFEVATRILQQCASYGYIADLEVSGDTREVTFRVNRSLARHFGFSYWKPQYETQVQWAIVDFALAHRDDRPSNWVASRAEDRRATARASWPGAVELPGLDIDSDWGKDG